MSEDDVIVAFARWLETRDRGSAEYCMGLHALSRAATEEMEEVREREIRAPSRVADWLTTGGLPREVWLARKRSEVAR